MITHTPVPVKRLHAVSFLVHSRETATWTAVGESGVRWLSESGLVDRSQRTRA